MTVLNKKCAKLVKSIPDPEIRAKAEDILRNGTPDDLSKYAREMADQFIEARTVTQRTAIALQRAKIAYKSEIAKGKSPKAAMRSFFIRTGHMGDKASENIPLEGLYARVLNRHHGNLIEAMEAYKVKAAGFNRSKKAISNLVRELFSPGSTKDPDARKYGKIVAGVLEDVRNEFNAAGGSIKNLENWALPMRHSARRLAKVEYEDWKAFVLSAEADLDIDGIKKMYKLSDEEFDKSLNYMYDSIVMDGFKAHVPPKLQKVIGTNLGDRHQEHRFFHFKSADGWMNYQNKFGNPNYWHSIMGYVDMMSRETAAMKAFGPAADKTVEYLQTLYRRSSKTGKGYKHASNLYENFMGRNVAESVRWAEVFSSARNIMVAAKLPLAIVSAMSDLAFSGLTAQFRGMSAMKLYYRAMKGMLPGNKETRKLAAQIQLGADFAVDRAISGTRYSEIIGHNWSSKLADMTIRMSGLNHWTNVMKQTFGLELMTNLAKLDSFGKRRTKKVMGLLQQYNISKADWDTIRSRGIRTHKGVDYVDPSLLNKADDEELVAKLVGMMDEETRFAVPEPGLHTKTMMVGASKPGTFAGEIVRTMGQFKTFPVSVITSHLMRIMYMSGPVNQLKYLVSMVAGTTVLGILAVNAKDTLKGKELRPFDGDMILRGFIQGGSAGLFGDLMDQVARGGFARTASGFLAGPLGGEIGKVLRALDAGDNIFDWEAKLAKGTKIATDLAPFQLPYTKLAMQRLFFDYVNQMADDNWHRKQMNIRRKMKKEEGRDWRVRPTGKLMGGYFD